MTTPNFNDDLRKQLFVFEDKDDRYDKKVADQLIRALGFSILTVKNDLGSQFGLAQVNQKYMPAGIAVAAAKFKKPVTLEGLIVNKVTASEHWKMYDELQQNWATCKYFAMVFDKHDDGVSDLIMHSTGLLLNKDAWTFSFIGPKDVTYYIQSFKAFLTAFSKSFNENHNGDSG